jgi:glycosyltransferase involved in cell wall biosynthesis
MAKPNEVISEENPTQCLKIKEELKQKDEQLKHNEYIITCLANELKEKEAIISNLKNTYSWKATAPLRWALDMLTSPIFSDKISLLQSRCKMIFNLFILFWKAPRNFLNSINRSSFIAFFCKFNRIHPAALENEVRKKLNSNLNKAAPTLDIVDNYFQMLAIPKEVRRVLVIDRFVPAYDTNSGALRMYSILNILNEMGCHITFIPDNLQPREPYVTELRRRGIEMICENVDIEAYFRKNGPRFSLVILSEALAAVNFMPIVRAYAVNATVIYDTVDLHWIRLERAAAITGDPQVLAEAEFFRKIEHYLINCSDIIFTVTHTEKEFLIQQNPELDVYVVPNVHDAVVRDTVPFSQRKDLMFIGHYLHQPNVDAVKYFVREIFPILQKRLGRIKFYIVGSNPTEEVFRLQSDDVVVTGYVPDVASYFESSRVFVAPLRFGAGMKGKIGQSMTFGLPVVTSGIGAEGMGLENGRHVLIAENTEAFVDAAERLYMDEDLWCKLSVESKQHIHNSYSTSAMQSIMSSILEHIEKQVKTCCR